MMTQVIAWTSLFAIASAFYSGLLVVMLVGLATWLAALLVQTRRRFGRLRRQMDRSSTICATGTTPAPESGSAWAEDSLSVLAAGFAHDFNNLLVSILANAELLRLSPTNDRFHDCVGKIIESAEAAANLTKQTSHRVGMDPTKKSRSDLNRLVGTLIPKLKARLRSNHEIRVYPTNSVLWSSVDSVQIEQIVANLVMNSADASPPGTEIEIRLGKARLDRLVRSPEIFGDRKIGGRFVYFEVVDHGGAIDRVSLGQVFQPLHSSKGVGRGLGLSIVLRCVNNHNGLVACHSEPGRGTTMRVLLPELIERRNNDPSTSRELLEGMSPGARQTQVAVVLEADQSARELVSRLLRQHGWRVAMFEDAESATIYSAKRGCDVRLFVANESFVPAAELDVASWMAERRRTVPVVVISKNPSRFAERGTTHGLVSVVEQPVSQQQFLAVLRDVVRRAANASKGVT